MLTPHDIDNKAFEKTVFGGYDMTMVDDFLEAVSGDYTALYKENAILKGKLKVLVEKVEEYRSTEDAMRMALLAAQRMGEDILADANKKSEYTLKSAEKEAAERIAEMEKRISEEDLKLSAAIKETEKFIEASRAMLQNHADFLSVLEKARRANAPSQAPAPEPEAVSEDAQQQQKIVDAASQLITNALESLQEADAAAAAEAEAAAQSSEEPEDEHKDAEDTKVYVIKDVQPAEDTPKPKFDIDNLKFGSNFNSDE